MNQSNVVYGFPPVYDRVRKVFDIEGKAVIFAYGDKIYNPFRAGITPDLFAHESVHSKQQALTSPDEWWDRYLTDADFRLSQEVEAYGAQYRYMRGSTPNRAKLEQKLDKIASDLSGRIYGNLCTYNHARKLIQEAANKPAA